MSDFRQLAPTEGAKMLAEHPEETWFPLAEMMRFFTVSEDELLSELRSGRLVATGTHDGAGNWRNIAIRGDNLVAWLCCGSPLANLSVRRMGAHS